MSFENFFSKLHDTQQLRELVIDELMSKVNGRMKGSEITILCPFHNDSRPSLGVHIGDAITPGGYHCWSCKAHGGWNSLAAKLGLKMYDFGNRGSGDKKYTLPEKDDPFGILATEIKKPVLTSQKVDKLIGTEELPDGFNWRGLGKRFLESLGAKFFWERSIDMDFLYFPLTMEGVYVGYTLAALKPHKPKYQTFAHTSEVYFLYDFVEPGSPIVCCEGHFDCLRLLSEGIPAIAIFGTTNWSKVKASLLVAKNPKKVVILMDGDAAGYKAAQDIYMDLRAGLNVEIMYLPPPNGDNKIDPGNMSHELVEIVRELLCL